MTVVKAFILFFSSAEKGFFSFTGACIQKLTATPDSCPGHTKSFKEKTAMVRAARQLLSAITRVLLLADKVVVKQLLAAKDRVSTVLIINQMYIKKINLPFRVSKITDLCMCTPAIVKIYELMLILLRHLIVFCTMIPMHS